MGAEQSLAEKAAVLQAHGAQVEPPCDSTGLCLVSLARSLQELCPGCVQGVPEQRLLLQRGGKHRSAEGVSDSEIPVVCT